MEKPIRAPARGRRAWQPQHLVGPFGRGRSLPEPPRARGGPGSGKKKCGMGHAAPGARKHRGLAIVRPAGTCGVLHMAPWLAGESAAAGRSGHVGWGRRDPTLARRARTRSRVHMITYTHVRPNTRAAYNSQGRRKETVGQKGEEMK